MCMYSLIIMVSSVATSKDDMESLFTQFVFMVRRERERGHFLLFLFSPNSKRMLLYLMNRMRISHWLNGRTVPILSLD